MHGKERVNEHPETDVGEEGGGTQRETVEDRHENTQDNARKEQRCAPEDA
jgi:hypothetical protein